MQSLKGKRLLILGGPALACDIVEKAKEIEIHTIVTDWYAPEKSPAKLIADEYAMVSTADIDELEKLIKEKNIDGVITGFIDSTLLYYQQICKRLNFPCYLTAEQIDITTNKIKFKRTCRDYGIPTVKEYSLEEISKNDFPVLLKPVDNSGARGIVICNNKKDLNDAYEYAQGFSTSGKVLIEEYINAEESTIFYTIKNGEPLLTGVSDRFVKHNQEGVIPLPVAYLFPSKYTKEFKREIHPKVVKMFEGLGMKNGTLFIQSFVKNGKYIFYEIGYRLTGSLEYKIYEKTKGINALEQMISFSLTGEMSQQEKKYNDRLIGCNITFLVKPGTIASIEGVNEARKISGVVDVFMSYKEGDKITEEAKGTLIQVVARAFVVAKSKEQLASIIDQVHNTIKVLSIDGDNMLLEKFNSREIL